MAERSPALNTLTDQEVVLLARGGQERAYRELVRRYERPIFSLLYRMWVDRTLYVEGREPLRSAYVELVATRKSDQGRRFATRLMERLALEIQGYDIGALSPAETTLYQRLGWERWHGALSVRTAAGVVPAPGEELMVLRLPGSPPVDLEAALAVDWRAGEVW